MLLCSNGHPVREVSRTRSTSIVENVIYRKERIKHFNREGSEFWTEIKIPDIEEKRVEMERIEYHCDECGENKTLEEEVKAE